MSVLLTIASLGPIFDAYDVKYLVIPGNIGIVISMMLIGLCKGQYIYCPSRSPNDFTHSYPHLFI